MLTTNATKYYKQQMLLCYLLLTFAYCFFAPFFMLVVAAIAILGRHINNK